MDYAQSRHIGDILRERNIEIVGADLATRHGFTQVPNFILTKPDISVGAKLAYAMLLKYAWGDDACFPGQVKLAEDMGATDRSVRHRAGHRALPRANCRRVILGFISLGAVEGIGAACEGRGRIGAKSVVPNMCPAARPRGLEPGNVPRP